MNNIYALTAEEGKEGEEGRAEAQEPPQEPQVEPPRTLSGLLKEGLRLPTYSIPWETYTTAYETIKRMNEEAKRKR
jgi:hypothetical protein